MMRWARWLLKKAIFWLLFLPLMLAGFVAFLLYTTPGLYFVLTAINIFSPTRIQATALQGSLANQMIATKLTLSKAGFQGNFENFSAHVDLRKLLQKDLHLEARFDKATLGMVGNHGTSMRLEKGRLESHGSLKKDIINAKLQAWLNHLPLDASLQRDPQKSSVLVFLKNNELRMEKKDSQPWSVSLKLPNPSLLHPTLSSFNALITADGQIKDSREGRLAINIHPGHMYLKEDKKKLAFEGGELELLLGNKAWKAEGTFLLDKNKKFNLSLSLPEVHQHRGSFLSQKIAGKIHFEMNSLAFLGFVHPLITMVTGQLGGDFVLSGQLDNPHIRAELKSKEAEAQLQNSQVPLKPIEFSLETKDRQWQLKASLFYQNKPLEVQGQGELYPHFTGKVALTGQDIPIINKGPDYMLLASPRLSLEIQPSLFKLSGTVLIPKAQIKPHTVTETKGLSEDMVFVTPTPHSHGLTTGLTAGSMDAAVKPRHLGIEFTTNISLEMGKDVEIAIKGVKGFLTGGVNLQKTNDKPMIAQGELSIRDGIYKAYGQDLIISEGKLIFRDEDIDNPEIHLRAIKQVNNATNKVASSANVVNFTSDQVQILHLSNKTILGIDASGRINNIKINLFSIPANLSKADILSMLLLDKPAAQASGAGAQLLLAAVSSLNLNTGNSGAELLMQLKQSLGIDINLEQSTQSQGAHNKTEVVIGKALSEKLYLSYNILGLSQTDNNKATLRYLLNQFFSLQVNASPNASGIDLLYSHQKE